MTRILFYRISFTLVKHQQHFRVLGVGHYTYRASNIGTLMSKTKVDSRSRFTWSLFQFHPTFTQDYEWLNKLSCLLFSRKVKANIPLKGADL